MIEVVVLLGFFAALALAWSFADEDESGGGTATVTDDGAPDDADYNIEEPEPEDEVTADDDEPEEKKTGADAEDASRKADAEEAQAKREAKGDDDSSIGGELLGRANQAGLTLEEARSFGSPRELERTVAILERQAAKAGKAEEGGEADTETKPEELDLPELNPELAEPEVVEWAKKQAAVTRALHAKVQKMEAAETAKETAAKAQREEVFLTDYDKRVSELPEEYQARYGKGSIMDMAEDASERTNRNSLLKRVDRAIGGYRSMGEKPPAMDVLLQEALAVDASGTVAEREREKVTAALDQRATQRQTRPSQAQTPDLPPGDQKALAALRTQMRKDARERRDEDNIDDLEE